MGEGKRFGNFTDIQDTRIGQFKQPVLNDAAQTEDPEFRHISDAVLPELAGIRILAMPVWRNYGRRLGRQDLLEIIQLPGNPLRLCKKRVGQIYKVEQAIQINILSVIHILVIQMQDSRLFDR